MKISKRQLRKIIREEAMAYLPEAEATIKYNADPALQGDQTKLPDELQKAIIDKDEEEEELKEMKITKKQLKRIIKEEKAKLLNEQFGWPEKSSDPELDPDQKATLDELKVAVEECLAMGIHHEIIRSTVKQIIG